jgi:hypothetical protein
MDVLVENIIELENQYIKEIEKLKKSIINLKNEVETHITNEISLNNTILELKTINKKSSSNEMWIQLNDRNKEIEILKKDLDFYKGKNFRKQKNEPDDICFDKCITTQSLVGGQVIEDVKAKGFEHILEKEIIVNKTEILEKKVFDIVDNIVDNMVDETSNIIILNYRPDEQETVIRKKKIIKVKKLKK